VLNAAPVRAEMRARQGGDIATRRRWIEELVSGETKSVEELAKRHRCSPRAARMTLNVAFLSPAIVKAAINGALPRGCGLTNLARTPADWEAQQQGIVGSR
jgi:hypothetical protein